MRCERQSVSHIRSWCPSRVPQCSARMRDLLRCLTQQLGVVMRCGAWEHVAAERMRCERQSVSHIRSWCPSRVPQCSARMRDLLRCLTQQLGVVVLGSMWAAERMRCERQSVSHIRSWCPSRVPRCSARMRDLLRCLTQQLGVVMRCGAWEHVGS